MVEISNPYTTPVTFNDQGLPVSSKEGHGFGVQSIEAFCKNMVLSASLKPLKAAFV